MIWWKKWFSLLYIGIIYQIMLKSYILLCKLFIFYLFFFFSITNSKKKICKICFYFIIFLETTSKHDQNNFGVACFYKQAAMEPSWEAFRPKHGPSHPALRHYFFGGGLLIIAGTPIQDLINTRVMISSFWNSNFVGSICRHRWNC